MAGIIWSAQLETGISTVDNQHRRWVEIYNDLDKAVQQGREQDALGETLEALAEYTNYHFRTEEALMGRSDIDEEEFDLHRRQHRVFTDQIAMYRDRTDAGSKRVTPEVVAYMRDWLVTHITDTDRGYIRPLREAGIA